MATREPSRVSSSKQSSRGDIRNTEAGMSKELVAAVKREEAINMPRNTERMSVLDENGNVLGTNTGKEGEVAPPRGVNLKDTIVTHNHPSADIRRRYGDTLASRVGASFSTADVVFAVNNNVKEVRAVTKGGYIYSLKRPANGWGANERQIRTVMAKYRAKFKKAMDDGQVDKILDFDSFSDMKRFQPRYNVASQHYTLKKLAADFGWKYTYRKA